MTTRQRLVVDTNALISRLIFPGSVPGRAVRKIVDEEQLLVSEATMLELVDVLARPKFDRYLSIEERQVFLLQLGKVAELVRILRPIHACRDPKDDKFLELAANGTANAILTGDADLLALHPFHGIAIITPADWLKSVPDSRRKLMAPALLVGKPGP
jgi:putative PIN family toxin of toxin-antitoxin system